MGHIHFLAAYSASFFFFANSMAAYFFRSFSASLSFFFYSSSAFFFVASSAFAFFFISSSFLAASMSASQALGYGFLSLSALNLTTSSSVTLARHSWNYLRNCYISLIRMSFTSPVRSSPLLYFSFISASCSSSSKKNVSHW